MFTSNAALIGVDAPAIFGLFEGFYLGMFKIFCPALSCRDRIGMDCAGGVNIALTVCPHSPQQPFGRHNGVKLPSFFWGDQTTIFNSD